MLFDIIYWPMQSPCWVNLVKMNTNCFLKSISRCQILTMPHIHTPNWFAGIQILTNWFQTVKNLGIGDIVDVIRHSFIQIAIDFCISLNSNTIMLSSLSNSLSQSFLFALFSMTKQMDSRFYMLGTIQWIFSIFRDAKGGFIDGVTLFS